MEDIIYMIIGLAMICVWVYAIVLLLGKKKFEEQSTTEKFVTVGAVVIGILWFIGSIS